MKKLILLILPFFLCSDQPGSKKLVLHDSSSFNSNNVLKDNSVETDTGYDKKNVVSLKNEPPDTTEQPVKDKSKSGYTELISIKGKRSMEDGIKKFLQLVPIVRYASSSGRINKLEGRITFRLSILETGKVNDCYVLSTTIKDEAAVKFLQSKVKRWPFGGIDAPEDKTELIFSLFLRKTGK